jgi:hypothetical protein
VLSLREASYALFGAWRLAHFDVQGTAYFDRSAEGALRSFWAAAILLPADAVMVLLHLSEVPPRIGLFGLILVYGSWYAFSWTAFPVAMIWLARLLDREEEYLGWLSMYNWSRVIGTLLVLPVSVLVYGELLPQFVTEIIVLATHLALLAYAWFIDRTALRIGAFGALGLVLIDLTISLLLLSISDQLAAGARLL